MKPAQPSRPASKFLFWFLIACFVFNCHDILGLGTVRPAMPSLATNALAGVVRHNLHLPQIRVHDPWILAYAPTRSYYLYTSNFGRITGVNRPGTMAYRSKDLRNWEGPLVVFVLPEGTWAANQPAWAPEVHEYKNQFYLFTTLHNTNKIIAAPPEVWRTNYMRGTVIAVSQSPEGPFTLLKTNEPVPPANFMTLDGTFYVDPTGKPWMVYAHEWIQKIDGTMEAVPLSEDLSDAIGSPIYLFKASDAPWLDEQGRASTRQNQYVTDGPELFRTKDNHLLMLWSSYDTNGYVETVARSKSGEINGPWEQLDPLVRNDSGHGMLFHTFDGKLMLVLHHPFNNARAKLYEMNDEGDHLSVLRERTDLDGDLNENH
jgi:beta-xylosidase